MATTSSEYRKRYEEYANSAKDAPIEIDKAIKKAYEGPVSQLIEEGNRIRPEAYSAFFNAFDQMGTGAADMSPSARLGAAISGGERGMSRLRTNTELRKYYDSLINDLVGKGLQAYQMGGQSLKDLYSMAFGEEQFAWQQSEAEKQRALQRALRGSSGGGGFTPFNLGTEDVYGNSIVGTGGSGNLSGGAIASAPSIASRIQDVIRPSGGTASGITGGARALFR